MNNLKKDIENINALLGAMECIKQDIENDVSNFFIENNIKYLKEIKEIKHKDYIKTEERKQYFKPMLNKLKEKYKSNFIVNEDEHMIEVVYDSEELNKKLEDENTFNEIIDDCMKFLKTEECWKLGICYDVLNQIKKENMNND